MVERLEQFEKIWNFDTEYTARLGELVEPICLAAREYRTGETVRLVGLDLKRGETPGFAQDPHALFVCYSGPAELGFMLAMNWDLPHYLIDLYAEFRLYTSGIWLPSYKFLDALDYFDLPKPMDSKRKAEMHSLAIRGGPFTEEELKAITDYCEQDVVGLETLFTRMVVNG